MNKPGNSVRPEMGSEFWYDADAGCSAKSEWCSWGGNQRFFMSGRTALYAILDDILASRKCRSACLPSWCCHTMIMPFLAHSIQVSFYSVFAANGTLVQSALPQPDCDIVLTMDYFGYRCKCPDIPKNAVIIHDMTQAVFSKPPEADYIYASFRKWDCIAAAAVAVKQDAWIIPPALARSGNYISMRERAYELKTEYMKSGSGDKSRFLHLFSAAEDLLERDYIGYAADESSLERAKRLDYMLMRRRENARFLINALHDLSLVQPIFALPDDGSVPLFVPVVVRKSMRDDLRHFLTENRVYCPVHWPLSGLHTLTAEERRIYETELSLICDQRYGSSDILREAELIRKFEREYG